MRLVTELPVASKRILLRTDFSTPLNEKGQVTNDKRIREGLPTIKYLVDNNAKIIILTKVGRPDGKVVENLRVNDIARRLGELLFMPIKKVDACIGPEVERDIAKLKEKEILMLENVRFYPQEEENDENFARQLAKYADYYVNDAFSVDHRDEASVSTIQKFIPSAGGFLLKREIEHLSKALDHPKQPYVAIIGGAKKDKINVIKNILPKLDTLIISGVLANTFLKAKGYDVGKSVVDNESLAFAAELLKHSGQKIMLPTDVVVSETVDGKSPSQIVPVAKIPQNMMICDAGPQTLESYKAKLKLAATIMWAGPIGIFEVDKFSSGTKQIAKALADSKAITIAGGGDTVSAVEKFNVEDKLTIVSTGGGATLDFLAGKKLPGIVALEENEQRFVLKVLV